MKKKIICVVGESCAGKDTIVNTAIRLSCILCKDIQLKPVVSYTTRPKRNNETDGVEHYFITTEEAQNLIQTEKILAYTKIDNPECNAEGYEYFATVEGLKDSNVYIIDPNGIDYMMKYVHSGDIEISIVYINTPSFIRKFRSRKRQDNKNAYKDRVLNERNQFKTFRRAIRCDAYPNAHIINNIFGVQNSAKKFCKIAKKFIKEN